MAALFTPFSLRGRTFRNRIFVSPMCQYSAHEGFPTTWHLVHLGSRAVGGAASVLVEATAVAPEGRISDRDLGLWSDEHGEALKPITAFLREQGVAPGIQIAHAGRKASTCVPWEGGGPLLPEYGGFRAVAPSALRFSEKSAVPLELSRSQIQALPTQFAQAAARAFAAGFEVLEVHAAHGYLLHEFLSPLSNQRTDDYGGSWENRVRLPLAVVQAVRTVWPQSLPLLVRISVTDWIEGGWDVEDSVRLADALKAIGVDLIDCSSGGLDPRAQIPAVPGYQVAFAERIRREVGIATGAVGLVTSAEQADAIIAEGRADAVLLGRELLRDPYWPQHAAHALGVEVSWPKQYERARLPLAGLR